MKQPSGLKRLGLFFAAVSVSLTACKKPDLTSGLDLLPGEDVLTALQTDTASITVFTEREDSLRTDELSSVMIGSYLDPVFGQVSASAVTQVRLSTSAASFPNVYEIDSVVLALVYSGDAYGRLIPQSFVVNELSGPLFLDSAYYSSRKPEVFPQNLIKPGFEWNEVKPEKYIQSEEDSLVPQLRLRLREELAQRLMSPADPSVLSSNTLFQEYFKGITVSAESYDAGIFNVILQDPDSRLVVYYRDLDGTEPDTTSYSFAITSDCARYTYIDHYYGASELSGLQSGPISGLEKCYVQAGAGAKVKINLPYIMDFNEIGGRTINGAELIIPFDQDNRYTGIDQLVLLYENVDGTLMVLPDQISQTIGGSADFSDGVYRFRIGRYVQRVLNGDISSRGLYLLSTKAGVSVNRVVCHGPGYSPDQAHKNMRLVLTLSAE